MCVGHAVYRQLMVTVGFYSLRAENVDKYARLYLADAREKVKICANLREITMKYVKFMHHM